MNTTDKTLILILIAVIFFGWYQIRKQDYFIDKQINMRQLELTALYDGIDPEETEFNSMLFFEYMNRIEELEYMRYMLKIKY